MGNGAVRPLSFGTITVNLIGCLIIGIILGAYLCRPDWPSMGSVLLSRWWTGCLYHIFLHLPLSFLQLLTSGDVTDVLFYGAVQILGGLAPLCHRYVDC